MHRGGEGLINSHQESAFPQCIEYLEDTNELSNYNNASDGNSVGHEVFPGAGQGREVISEVGRCPVSWL